VLDLSTALILDGDGDELSVTARFAMDQEIAAALPTGSPNVEVVDAALRALDSSGTLTRLHHEWIEPSFGTHPSTLPVIRT
jgi:ABC-type amino acid transport substrate-binding protein